VSRAVADPECEGEHESCGTRRTRQHLKAPKVRGTAQSRKARRLRRISMAPKVLAPTVVGCFDQGEFDEGFTSPVASRQLTLSAALPQANLACRRARPTASAAGASLAARRAPNQHRTPLPLAPSLLLLPILVNKE